MSVAIRVIRGINLPSADANGLSDPYVVVIQEGVKKNRVGKTKTKKGTLTPSWDEEFLASGIRGLKIKFVVYDWDRFSADDKLGDAEFDPFEHPFGTEVELPIKTENMYKRRISPHKLVVRLDLRPENEEPFLQSMGQGPLNYRRMGSPALYAVLSWAPPAGFQGAAPFPLLPQDPMERSIVKSFPRIPAADLAFVGFHHKQVKIACFLGDKKEKGTRHSGRTLVYGPHGFGLAIRIQLTKAFHACDVGTFAVSALQGRPVAELGFPVLDLILANEPKSLRPKDTPRLAYPVEHIRRIPLQEIGTTSVLCARLGSSLGIDPTCVQPVQRPASCWAEILPEIQGWCGVPITPNARAIHLFAGKAISTEQIVPFGIDFGQRISVGLGWEFIGGANVDLDSSIIMANEHFDPIDTVSFRQLRSRDGSIIHSGDNRTGAGSGDDETIHINLHAVPPQVKALGVVVNSFTGQLFGTLSHAYVRMHQEGRTFIHLKLSDAKNKRAVILCVLLRDQTMGWQVIPCLKFLNAQTVSSCAAPMKQWMGKMMRRQQAQATAPFF